jgi:uncharacterized protein YjbI with pentapeptide repeats
MIMRSIIAVVGAALMLCPVPAFAQPSEDEDYPPSVELGQWVADLKVGPKMNAAGRNLRGSVFVSQDLRGATFARCDISSTRFANCDLSGASFKGAVFADATIEGCKLAGADFDDATVNGANSSQEGLRTIGTHLSEKQLQSTRSYRTRDLTRCTIAASNWDRAKPLVKFDFRGAYLLGAYLVEGDFSDCDFTGARIDELSLIGAQISFKQLASTCNYRNPVLGKKNPSLPKLHFRRS